MIEYSQEDLILALKGIGIKEGDILQVSTELFRLGRLKGVKSSEELSKKILESIFHVIKETGTVVVNTYTTYVGRYGVPFDYEHSKPTTGSFSEYVLSLPDSVRSLHPINSVAAIGYDKDAICLNVSASNYGIDSPFSRLLDRKCQVLRLGLDYVHNVFYHVAETLYGLPYIYNKVLDAEVIVQGEKINKKFFSAVRYLQYPIEETLDMLKDALGRSDCVHSAELGGGLIHSVDANEYFNIVISLLKEDPYIFLKEPPKFIKGEIPWDGITAGRDRVPNSANYILRPAREENSERHGDVL